MKKYAIILMLFVLSPATWAQNLKNELKQSDLKLKVESSNGNNGLSVTYNPKTGYYYTVYAGNESFALEQHNGKGESVHSTTARVDARGMWYSASCNCLQGSVHNNKGYYELSLNNADAPDYLEIFPVDYKLEGQGQTVSDGKYMYSLHDNGTLHKFKKGSSSAKKYYLGQSYGNTNELNNNGIVYTGIKNMEIGVINYRKSTLELFSAKKGVYKKTIQLTMNEVSLPSAFNVSFANDHLFIYNKEDRTWYGYAVK